MKQEYFEVSVLDSGSHNRLYSTDVPYEESKSKWFSAKRLGIILALTAFVGLALGLGLGLGLNNSSDDNNEYQEPQDATGCDYFTESMVKHHRVKKRAIRSKRWLTESSIPTPGQAICPEGFDEPPLLVISMDGFRAEYLTRGFTPTLQKLSEGGVHTPYIRSTFPTKTFPNHYTIMTGLYTEAHGIIDNTMYDFEFKEQFIRGGSALDGKWWGGEPMWLTSKRQGKKSATMFWPGSESNITGEYPDYCYYYDESVDFDSRIGQVLDWLRLDREERPSFITLYFNEPDSTGHDHGPFATEIDEQLAEMDRLTGSLMDGIADLGLEQCINIIIMADHGMGELLCGYTDRTVYMEDYLDVSQYYIYEGVHGRITSKYVKNPEGGVTEVPNPESSDVTLDKLQCTGYNITKDWYTRFYHKRELPKRLHYASNPRIDDIVIELEDKWRVVEDRDSYCEAGSHGYDNTYKSMHALFMAFGPAFKQSFLIEPFENIEVYNLMAEVLEVTPADNNGTQGRLHHVLSNPQPLQAPPPAASDYTDCLFPDDDTADMTRNMTDCQCDDLQDVTSKSIEELDLQLNLTEEQKNTSVSTHLPYGVPQIDLGDLDVCQLTQTSHVTGYSEQHSMPLWTAFQLNKLAEGSVLDPGTSRSDRLLTDCVRADVRLDTFTNCSQYVDTQEGITHSFLYPPGFANSTDGQLDGHINSNIVPMYEHFRNGVWQQLLFLLEEYAEKYESINAIMGPIFDYNSDGVADDLHEIQMFVGNGSVPVPTHYYVTATYCEDENDCTGTTHTFSVILLHSPVLTNCWDRKIMRYIKNNVARVRDIELLTGLRFFTSVWNLTERVLLQTQLEVGLWPRISWMDLSDEEAIAGDGAQCPSGYNSDHPPVILISIDGFRNDYIYRNLTPTLTRLRELGVKTDHLRSIYPTMTFPNHYTQVTGLYAESHGIVDNSMCDPDLGVCFSLGSPLSMESEWWGGEPIWNTLELQNKTAMAMFWPGSDVEIQGTRPTKFQYYDDYYPYELRVDTVLEWLNGSAGVTPDLVTLYFSSVDSAGHETGPLSIEVEEVMQVLDGYIQDLMDGIYRQKLHKCVNIIVVSDHGMSSLSCDRSVLTADHLSESTMDNTYTYSGSAPRISNEYRGQNSSDYIIPTPEGNIVESAAIVSNLTCVSSNMMAFEKEDLPRRLHYTANSRIEAVILKMKDAWQADRYSAWCGIKGQHGWDPSFDSMKAFFLAFGPSFKSKTQVVPFESIELYNLISVLTDVTPAPNNGTQGSLYHLLVAPPQLPVVDVGTNYTDCEYAETEEEYDRRSNLSTAGCQCDVTAEEIEEYDSQLDTEEDMKEYLESVHLPHGVPWYAGDVLCLLHHTDYVSGYTHAIKMPVFTAFRLTAQQVSDEPTDLPECLRPDVRLEQSEQALCQDYTDTTVEQTLMFPPEFASNESSAFDSLITSNTVPMFSTFRTGVWQDLLSLIKEWAIQLEEIYVVMGPVFDYMADGLPDSQYTLFVNGSDIPVPSHYHATVIHCPREDCALMDYTVKSFILPHKQHITNCMNSEDYLVDNMGRIRDMELLTGLQLLTANSSQQALQTRTFLARDLTW